jgi:hypothetical protein
MKTRDRPNFRNKLVKTTTISVAVLVAAIMIISAIPTIATPVNTTKMNIIEKTEPQIDPTGLDPVILENNLKARSLQIPMAQPSGPISEDGFFYACDAFSPYPVVRWELETGEGKETLATSGENNYFLAGGTYSCEEVWYGCEYNSGGLWTINPDDGSMEQIGGGGTSVNGLAWDPVYNRLYGLGSGGLYEYDPETGEQEFIGSTGQSVAMIGMVIDMQGVAWSWDVKFSGNAKLYNVDLESGECTEIYDMGQNLLYAQDGDLDRDTGIIWFCAYSGGGFYAYWDWDNEELVTLGSLDSEYACGMIRSLCVPPEHDVGVKAILKPTQSGHAVPEMEMELLVKNYGNNTETFDAQMEIIKCEDSGFFLMQEDFDDGVMPENWTTDFWQIQNTNYASGTAPEAAMYKYWQSGGGQYYDNYIMSAPVDATGWEKLTMTFRWGFEPYGTYAQYCNFYVKWRKNDTSPWKDLSPWDNPLGEEYEGDLYEIDCYGFGEELGEGFQVMFQYIGYYYYYNWFWLDELWIQGCGGCAEYAELNEDITLAKGEETTISFPTWTPSEWQNESWQDTWEGYPIHGFVIMEGDQNPRNNDKWQLLELYYPWFYDIEITEIGSPSEGRSIPAQTFDVEATITNVGQFPACCIGIDIEIGAPYVLGSVLEEYDWPYTGWPYYYLYGPGYGSGWRDEHKNIAYYYGFEYRSYSPMAGGEAPEAMARYYRLRADYIYKSPVFDSTDYASLQLSFLSMIDHFSGTGLYALEAGYTLDGENWYAAWHEEPSGNENYEVEVPIEGGSATTQIGFWVKGNPYYMDYWYIDNVKVQAVGLDVEWSDFMCQGDDLEPGQSRVFNFDQWTPEFLAEETTAWEVPYKVFASIDVEVDQDPGNNIMNQDFKLDYWHDPALHSVASPADGGRDLLWENGDPDGRNGVAGSVYYGYENLIVDDIELESEATAYGGHISLLWNSGSGTGNLDTLYMWFFEDDEDPEDCEPSQDEYAMVEIDDFTERLTGDSYFGRPEVEITVSFEDVVMPAGHSWVGFQPDSVGEDIAYLLTAENKGCEVMADLPYWGYPRWSSSSYLWGDAYDLSWQLTGDAKGPPGIKAYVQPGTQSIDALAINYGTFNELDQTCTAEIWEYITDPENGTKQYEDAITNIDLDEPLGGTYPLAFDDFTFAYEGRYGLFLAMPDANGDDDFPKNNAIRWGVGVDDTDPESYHTLNPADPDGENDWYVNDLEVTLYASDPLVMDVSSGADFINYRVNDGTTQTIDGNEIIEGTFLITQADDKDDVKVEYWAVDNVGNSEDSHTFYIDMDQTDPTVDLTYEVISGNPIQGWVLEFTATCNDATSGMDRVEFFLNAGLQSVVSGSGPTYQWSWTYFGDLSVDIRADAYDIAGNMADDIIEDPVTTEFSNQQQQTIKILQG